ncbi:MAG: hypothetical protein Q9218_003678 [Villophora microphyllina]
MARFILLTLAASAVALGGNAALLPNPIQDVEPRAARPTCVPDSNVVVNGDFYGYLNPPSYAPFTVSSSGGGPGCKYLNDYRACQGFGGPFDESDPNCFACQYGIVGGSTTIGQEVSFTPGCHYAIEVAVACSGHNAPYLLNNSTDYGTPQVSFRVLLDHETVIPKQLSCPICTSSDQFRCSAYPDPTYRVITGYISAPPSGNATLKVLISQGEQNGTVSPLMITAVRMVTFGNEA